MRRSPGLFVYENAVHITQYGWMAALSRLIRSKTVLIIAHRMRTVSGADKIVVLKDGAVAEQGTPGDLLQKGGIFAHMDHLQTESQSRAPA